MEQWKEIKGYEGLYQVSSQGRVRSLVDNHHKKYQKPKMRHIFANKGYLFVALIKDGQRKNKLVHRLVAEAFLPKIENKNEVNHLDGNKANNCLSNLEWSTRSENIKHMYRELGYKVHGGVPKKKTMCIETGLVYKSLMEAGEKNGMCYSCIGRACRGETSQAYGYHWKYI